jgi:hypothetical protein
LHFFRVPCASNARRAPAARTRRRFFLTFDFHFVCYLFHSPAYFP